MRVSGEPVVSSVTAIVKWYGFETRGVCCVVKVDGREIEMKTGDNDDEATQTTSSIGVTSTYGIVRMTVNRKDQHESKGKRSSSTMSETTRKRARPGNVHDDGPDPGSSAIGGFSGLSELSVRRPGGMGNANVGTTPDGDGAA